MLKKKYRVLSMDEMKEVFGNLIETKMRDLGMDKIDAKSGMFKTPEDPNGDALKNLSKEERVKKFLQAVVNNDTAVAKALSEGVDADGGFLVPPEFRAQVISKLAKESVIRPRATVIPMGSSSLEIPADGNAVSVSWPGENTESSESNPTFGGVTLTANLLVGLSKMSRALFEDTKIDITDYIATLFAKAFKVEEDKQFMTGNGTGKPKGIRAYTFDNTVAQAGASIVGDDLIALFYKLGAQYRKNACWMLHNDIIAKVRTLKDSVTGRYIWADGLGEAPATILGRPVLEQNDIPTNLGVGTDESEIFFGDISYYLIGDREQMGIEATTQGAGTFEKHQVALKAFQRLDGKLGQTEAFAKLTAVK